METTNPRVAALMWWDSLMSFDKDTYFKVYKEDNFTPAQTSLGLTGREIEIIWRSVPKEEVPPKELKTLLWLDDYRDPNEIKNGIKHWLVFSPITPDEVVWVKNYNEFVEYITKVGLPDAICFDHDLGDSDLEFPDSEKSGMECVKWLVNYCIDYNKPLPLYNIQSANTVGKENMDKYLKNYLKSTKN